jgi:hypothetical protein
MAVVINGSGTVTGISVGGLPDDIVDSGTLADDAVVAAALATNSVTADALEVSAITVADLPAGSVLQIVSTTKTDTYTFSASSAGYTDVTGLTATITPTASSSKILVQVNINFSSSMRYAAANCIRVLSGSAAQVGGGTAASSRPSVSVQSESNQDETNDQFLMRNSSFSFLDSPSTTAATTYKIQVGNTHESSSVNYVNRSENDVDGAYSHRGQSTITLTEVAG